MPTSPPITHVMYCTIGLRAPQHTNSVRTPNLRPMKCSVHFVLKTRFLGIFGTGNGLSALHLLFPFFVFACLHQIPRRAPRGVPPGGSLGGSPRGSPGGSRSRASKKMASSEICKRGCAFSSCLLGRRLQNRVISCGLPCSPVAPRGHTPRIPRNTARTPPEHPQNTPGIPQNTPRTLPEHP